MLGGVIIKVDVDVHEMLQARREELARKQRRPASMSDAVRALLETAAKTR